MIELFTPVVAASVVSFIIMTIFKYNIDKSLNSLEKVPLYGHRIDELERKCNTLEITCQTIERDLRNSSERLIRVETLLQEISKKLD